MLKVPSANVRTKRLAKAGQGLQESRISEFQKNYGEPQKKYCKSGSFTQKSRASFSSEAKILILDASILDLISRAPLFSCPRLVFCVVKYRILSFSHLLRILAFTTQNPHLGQEKSGAREIKPRNGQSKMKIWASD